MDHLWYKKWAVRSCFIRWAQYLALFILVSRLWVLIPCAAIGGRYLQGWERWVTACGLQRLLRPYWNGRMGPGVGLGDPASLGPQHRRAVLLALVLNGRLQRCKRGQESPRAPNSLARAAEVFRQVGWFQQNRLTRCKPNSNRRCRPWKHTARSWLHMTHLILCCAWTEHSTPCWCEE